jgi:putative GTP pyrophosphokinase
VPPSGRPTAELRTQYEAIRPALAPQLAAFAAHLAALIAEADLKPVLPIDVRLKSWSSIEEKLTRVPMNLRSINDLDDLLGARVIFLYGEDLRDAAQLVERKLEISKEHLVARHLGADKFGYNSLHYVIQWGAGGQTGRIELQLRTLAQHIWATASHDLQYKRENTLPLGLRRAMNRVSAVLEIVDDELNRLRYQHRDYNESGFSIEDLEAEELSVINLQLTVDSLLPDREVSPNHEYVAVLGELLYQGVRTRAKLREVIFRHRTAAFEIEKTVMNDAVTHGRRPWPFTHVELLRAILISAYGDKYRMIRSSDHDE